MDINGKKIIVDSYGKKTECRIITGRYDPPRLAITLETYIGEPFGTLTVNLPDDKLDEGEFFVKTWSENEGLAKSCMNSGAFIDTGKRVKTGYVEAQVWRFAG